MPKGPVNVAEFFIVLLEVSISWDICLSLSNGSVPAANRGNSSEKAVYLNL